MSGAQWLIGGAGRTAKVDESQSEDKSTGLLMKNGALGEIGSMVCGE